MKHAARLNRNALPPGTSIPRPGIVHLGLGAFFRAHIATYLADAMEASGGDWGVVGISLQSTATPDKLAPQDNMYNAVEAGPTGHRFRLMCNITEAIAARGNPAAVLERMADPSTKIVTLTVTEKGYCHEPATGRLRRDAPEIKHDLIHPDAPQTAIGYLVRALDLRRRAGHRPFTVLSCDNLPGNGHMTRALVLEFAEAMDETLAVWIEAEARFPNCMVDRIVPATTEADIDMVAAETGWLDLTPVIHEPFRQWVIEDDFVDDLRPAMEKTGAQMVRDVTPFEDMKLRCLNGTHSALAYLGYLSGYDTVNDTVADPVFETFCLRLWDTEIIPTLEPVPDMNMSAYSRQLLERYHNQSIRHATSQIAMDGSQKLPQRILGTIRDNLMRDHPCPGLFLVVAAWMKYASGVDEDGARINVSDPLAGRTAGLWQNNPSARTRTNAFLAIRDVFGARAEDRAFRVGLESACSELETFGARGAVERSLQ
ncbi:mannitol dehydrogenase family protein [Alisedimentitalea sp. MJ-SS2]|uniref:mannitol dehydrogenase family protein n=1 Tax=Aliisedimentitalea sp. MJ-SS2 TaxID=3049795 RepID=UPI002911574E|nr:mannitol dehydrogenase family protein [Alisedimentitalea sp. MJ-SS2]MDU8927035.1 mannitol dehydrogenase family protein [Alisedimentitalea sp. MJ-SS2]